MPLTPVVSFVVHCFFLPFSMFGRDFLPSILVVIILFWGIFLVTFLINLHVGLSLWFTFGFEEFLYFNIGVLHLLQVCGYYYNMLFFR